MTEIKTKAWDVWTCEHNHPCYLLIRELTSGSKLCVSDLIPLGGMPKIILDMTQLHRYRCVTCEGLVFPANPRGVSYLAFYNRGKLVK